MADSNIGNEGVKELTKLTNLTSLTLVGNNISDEGAKELTKLINLTYLDLSENNIGDEGAKELVKLTNLTYLALSGNNISYKVAEELVDKLVNLTEFNLLDNDANNENGNVEHTLEGVANVDKPELNNNHVSMQVLKQESNSGKNSNTPHSTQKNKLSVITVSTLTIAGVVSGVAIAVYLEMLVVGTVVGACCLVAAGIVYYCNKPASLLEDSNFQKSSSHIQEFTCPS